VNDVLLVDVLQGVQDLISDVRNHAGLQLSLFNTFEVAASHNFLDDAEIFAVLKDVKNAHNTRMVCVIKDVHFRP